MEVVTVSHFLHDWWLDLDAMVVDSSRSLRLPVAESQRDLRKSTRRRYWLVVKHVTGTRIEDTERVGFYDIREVSALEAPTRIVVTGNIPFAITIMVDQIDVCVVDEEADASALTRSHWPPFNLFGPGRKPQITLAKAVEELVVTFPDLYKPTQDLRVVESPRRVYEEAFVPFLVALLAGERPHASGHARLAFDFMERLAASQDAGVREIARAVIRRVLTLNPTAFAAVSSHLGRATRREVSLCTGELG
jgi:hypothetical protein